MIQCVRMCACAWSISSSHQSLLDTYDIFQKTLAGGPVGEWHSGLSLSLSVSLLDTSSQRLRCKDVTVGPESSLIANIIPRRCGYRDMMGYGGPHWASLGPTVQASVPRLCSIESAEICPTWSNKFGCGNLACSSRLKSIEHGICLCHTYDNTRELQQYWSAVSSPQLIWLVVSTPLKIWKSVGIIVPFPIYGKS